METKHTPGPWTHGEETDQVTGGPQGMTSIANLFSRPDHWEGHPSAGAVVAEQRANARLIAAAPDLLEALRGLVQTIEWQEHANFLNEDADEGEENALTIARAAITKATQP